MKSYLEILVPIKYDDPWLEMLRRRFTAIPVIWQKGFYHITMVFIDNKPKGIDMRPLLEKHLSTAQAPTVSLDLLDAFTRKSGGYVICLMTSHVPTHLLALIESIRADMQTAGCVISSDFKLHVTLGRVNSSDASLSEIKEEISSITPPSFMLTLTDVDYRIYRGRTIYETQLTP